LGPRRNARKADLRWGHRSVGMLPRLGEDSRDRNGGKRSWGGFWFGNGGIWERQSQSLEVFRRLDWCDQRPGYWAAGLGFHLVGHAQLGFGGVDVVPKRSQDLWGPTVRRKGLSRSGKSRGPGQFVSGPRDFRQASSWRRGGWHVKENFGRGDATRSCTQLGRPEVGWESFPGAGVWGAPSGWWGRARSWPVSVCGHRQR